MDRVSSPAATGGAGTFFEQHVGAYWLAQLLVQAVPPIMLGSTVSEVHFQTEHAGWNTDDFLIVCLDGNQAVHKLVGQVKRTFSVSASDSECTKAIQDYWKDFEVAARFSPAADRFVLVTLRGTNVLLEDFGGLLDCARAAIDAADFEHRLETPGFVTGKAVHYCNEIRTIVSVVEGRDVTRGEIWSFLKVLHILVLDLHSSTRQTEAGLKSLLAHTVRNGDSTTAAEASWATLLEAASQGMAEARSYRHSDLPHALRERHSPLGGREQQILRNLKHHSAIVLRGIASTIGGNLHLPRIKIVQSVLGKLESSQVVILTGPAGSGKSAVAKDVVDRLNPDHFVFSFRAEEFARPHFDATLQSAQIQASATDLAAIVAAQDRKVLLIESVERLLEKSTREAFTDLISLIKADDSWRLILTCRDYSVDLVRSSFLEFTRIDHAVVAIPQLDDSELEEVTQAHEKLARPLSNPTLRRILRNPYVLDKALSISWSADRPLPESEKQFRTLFWQQIVRAEHRDIDAMPHRREEAFEQIAIRRARALTMYVSAEHIDPVVVDNLRHDSLLVASDHSTLVVTPAHDVLEDWAILRWIEKQHFRDERELRGIFAAIGNHPAIRRAYRKWVSELVEANASEADRLFREAVVQVDVPAQFRDDTLVSLLQASSACTFLESQKVRLLENNLFLLRRVIHLLRVACVTTPTWFRTQKGHGSLLNIPDGPAWACLLSLVRDNINEFAVQDQNLLLGLIEDWSRGVSLWQPYPDGAESAAAIAHWLLPGFDNYHSDKQRQRTLKVIAKIPRADAVRFKSLLTNSDDEARDRVGDDFREMIFAETEGVAAARDLPNFVVSGATRYLLCSEEELEDSRHHYRSLDLELLFGVKEGLRHDYFPPSAYRGPLLPLLRNHPLKGLALITKVFNHSADWYAHPRVSGTIEQPFEIELKFSDGTVRKQWGNARLWKWYRETSVGPYVLMSLLMALERWLLEVADANSAQLDGILLNILRASESAALTAVVASLGVAFPHLCPETLLVLLQSPICIGLDRQRMVSEHQSPSKLAELLPSRPENKLYTAERKDADERPHRKHDLETAIANLQLGSFAKRVHDILDEQRAAMPPVSEQDDRHRVWRLAIHRMDLRQYTAEETAEEGPKVTNEPNGSGKSARGIRLTLADPEPDVKQMVEKSSAYFTAINAKMGTLMWGLRVFKREDGVNAGEWRAMFARARASEEVRLEDEDRLVPEGADRGVVAAVCVRDHWNELSEDEKNWCINVVCSEIMRQGDAWNYHVRLQRFEMSADRSCASVAPLLLTKSLTQAQSLSVERAFAVALTHPINEVRWYAAWGIAWHLASTNRELTLRCVNAIATEAGLVDEARRAEETKPYDQRNQIDHIEQNAAASVREHFWGTNRIDPGAYERLDVMEWFGAEAHGRILAILQAIPRDPAAGSAFIRAGKTLVGCWDEDDARDHTREQRNHDSETALSQMLQSFVMKAQNDTAGTILEPILAAVDRHSDKVHWFIQGLITSEDRQPNSSQFWSIWELFAERLRTSIWLSDLDEEHSDGRSLVSIIFLGPWWKEEARHWRSLEGHAYRVHALFEGLPPSSTVFHDYVRFLYHIGEQSLPDAFLRVARYLKDGHCAQFFKNTDTVFMLEVLLQRYVYGKPLELKQSEPMRVAILFLLDSLVESGSSAAFRMRDDFVTPISTS